VVEGRMVEGQRSGDQRRVAGVNERAAIVSVC
jgi:hypothetical protein